MFAGYQILAKHSTKAYHLKVTAMVKQSLNKVSSIHHKVIMNESVKRDFLRISKTGLTQPTQKSVF